MQTETHLYGVISPQLHIVSFCIFDVLYIIVVVVVLFFFCAVNAPTFIFSGFFDIFFRVIIMVLLLS